MFYLPFKQLKVSCKFDDEEEEEKQEEFIKNRRKKNMELKHDTDESSNDEGSTLSSSDSSAAVGEALDEPQSSIQNLSLEAQKNNNKTMKPTLSQSTMNSHLFNSLPKYIFQSTHAALKSVNSILEEAKEQQRREAAINASEVESMEYPIEYIENQQHALQRHLSIKYELFSILNFT
jgi:hypothetical protein